MKRLVAYLLFIVLVFQIIPGFSQQDPAIQKMIEIGRTDNQAMRHEHYLTNVFGGRLTGSVAYTHAAEWAVSEFRKWGLQAELDYVAEMPVGFVRGPWFGRMVKPVEKTLIFGTPSYTAGTKGVQKGTVVLAPKDDVELETMKGKLKGAWVLIEGANSGWARDGGRGSGEIPERTKKYIQAGVLGTIQSARYPITLLEGTVSSWDNLPELPDIKLMDSLYVEIKDMVSKGETVELEFDIRNHFYPGPVKYYNVIAWLPGTTNPDELIVMGGHFDSFDSATGAVDDASGFTPMMEALRIIAKSGTQPKRTIMVHGWAAEEKGPLISAPA